MKRGRFLMEDILIWKRNSGLPAVADETFLNPHTLASRAASAHCTTLPNYTFITALGRQCR